MSLAFERLESRVLLAVNVTKKGSTLLVEFDADGDPNLTLTGTALGNITVTNANTGDGPYEGIKNIKIVGGAGADDIVLIDIRIAGNVTADMKGGNDDIGIGGADTDIGGNIKAKLGDGNDDFAIDADFDDGPIKIGKNVSVDLGSSSGGTDLVTLFGNNGTEVITIGGGVTVKQKDGTAVILVDSALIAKNLKVDTGAGDDLIYIGTSVVDSALTTSAKAATIKTGDGDDTVRFGESDGTVAITKNLTVDLGNAGPGGDSLIAAFDVDVDETFTVGGNVSIKGKGGAQHLDLDGFAVTGNVKISLGDGDDTVDVSQLGGDIDATIGKNLDVKLGDGNDTVNVSRLAITKNAKADGGAGTDDGEIVDDGTVTVGGKSSGKNFETGDLQAALNA